MRVCVRACVRACARLIALFSRLRVASICGSVYHAALVHHE